MQNAGEITQSDIFVGIPSTGDSEVLYANIKLHKKLGNEVYVLFNGKVDSRINLDGYLYDRYEMPLGSFKARYLIMKKFLNTKYNYLYLEDDDDIDLESMSSILNYKCNFPVQFDYYNMSMKRYIGILSGEDKFSMVHGSISVATLLPRELVSKLIDIIESVGEVPKLTLYDDLILNNLILNISEKVGFAKEKVANYACSEVSSRSMDEANYEVIYNDFNYVLKYMKYFNRDYFYKTSIVANSYIFYNFRHKILELNPNFC